MLEPRVDHVFNAAQSFGEQLFEEIEPRVHIRAERFDLAIHVGAERVDLAI